MTNNGSKNAYSLITFSQISETMIWKKVLNAKRVVIESGVQWPVGMASNSTLGSQLDALCNETILKYELFDRISFTSIYRISSLCWPTLWNYFFSQLKVDSNICLPFWHLFSGHFSTRWLWSIKLLTTITCIKLINLCLNENLFLDLKIFYNVNSKLPC